MRAQLQVVVLLCLVAASVVVGQVVKRKPQRLRCDTSDACFPMSADGPYCRRGDNINLRFQVQLAPEQYRRETSRDVYVQEGWTGPITNMTYAFCPRADELAAFNITRLGQYALTFENGTEFDPVLNVTYRQVQHTVAEQVYLSAIGFGDQRNVNFPQNGSESRVMIADYNGGDFVGEYGIVDFLVLNISLEQGRLKYYEEHLQPAGTGFVPTCTVDSICKLDPTMRCFGARGQQNCGRCITDTYEMEDWRMTIWASYYGTDAAGRQLRSGASNPLNFQAFSGSGVTVAMGRSFDKIENGGTMDDDDLSPDGEIRADNLRDAAFRFGDE